MKRQNPEKLGKMISGFSCSKDSAVEKFLKTNALYFEQEGFSRTYLYITDETTPRIAAFFTVAITATSLEGIRTSRRKKILGGKPGRDAKDHFGGLLIAQIGRSDGFSTTDINGAEMIEAAEEIIEKGRYYLGGKVIYLDCESALIGLYKSNGYELVSEEPFYKAYYKMFKPLTRLM